MSNKRPSNIDELVQQDFANKWQQAEELEVPEQADQAIKQRLMSQLESRSKAASRQSLSSLLMTRFMPIAASLLVIAIVWQQLVSNPAHPDQTLVQLEEAVRQSQQLEATLLELKQQGLSEAYYLQKLALEEAISVIDSKLIETYGQQAAEQDQLQLWKSRNHKLAQLQELYRHEGSQYAVRI